MDLTFIVFNRVVIRKPKRKKLLGSQTVTLSNCGRYQFFVSWNFSYVEV